MTIILDSLKKTFDEIALLVKLGVEVMLHFGIDFVGNEDKRASSLNVITNRFGGESFVGKNFFACEIDRCKQGNGFFAVMNLSAGQDHVQEVHFFVDEHVNFGVFATA